VKLDLIATIRDIRFWRFGVTEPPWLPPIAQSALELGLSTGLIDNANSI
jgi:hypothetical protein